LKKQVWIIKNG